MEMERLKEMCAKMVAHRQGTAELPEGGVLRIKGVEPEGIMRD